MQDAYWNGLFDTRWEDVPLGREAIRLVLSLRKDGYNEKSRRECAHAVVHLGRVLQEAQGEVTVRDLDEAIIKGFIRTHLPICCCYHRRPGRRAAPVRLGLAHLLAMLREEGRIAPSVSVEPIYHELLGGYCRFLRDDCGLAENTIVNYRRYVRDFLVSRGDAVSADALVQLTADDLLVFGRERGASLGVTTLPTLLRGFFETYLAGQRDVSPNTIFAYRDSIKLLLRFAAHRVSRQVIRLQVDDLGPDTVLAFLILPAKVGNRRAPSS